MRGSYTGTSEPHVPLVDRLDGRLGRAWAGVAGYHRRAAAAWDRRRLALRRRKILETLRNPLTGPVRDHERPLSRELDLVDHALDRLGVEAAA